MAAYIGFLDSIEDEGDDDSQMEDIVEHPEFDDWYEADDFPHDTPALRQIKDRRKRMGNELFIDKLLIFTGLEVGELYPPNKIDDMRKLWWKILNCDLDSLKKYCIVYYLLKDWNGDKEGFAQRYLIPTGCMRLMDGYWAIDHWDFEAALRQLAYPTVEVDWPSKIVEVLYEHAGPRTAARFVNIAQPALWTPEEVELQMDVDVHCDVVGAFLFQVSEYRGPIIMPMWNEVWLFYLTSPDVELTGFGFSEAARVVW
ncbi:nuclear pore complex assembly-domain-containing protein [Jimgerdemannia flammicorona]|uniref:Nuclear pore complex assembly-domain-containing protein n=1 Tax=Jimgerdemannia flammicorona TaxID=994334 RepID=A0A433QEE3_9FUNG|nr:nuclear pore complex assembly-domain-containing protein [Jimgerdemannia flammicorona]